jgi:hypothetical protein
MVLLAKKIKHVRALARRREFEANWPKRTKKQFLFCIHFYFYWRQKSNTGTAAGIEANWTKKNKTSSVFVLFTFYWQQNSKNKKYFCFCFRFAYNLLATNFKQWRVCGNYFDGNMANWPKKHEIFCFVYIFFGDKIHTLAWPTTATQHHQEARC